MYEPSEHALRPFGLRPLSSIRSSTRAVSRSSRRALAEALPMTSGLAMQPKVHDEDICQGRKPWLVEPFDPPALHE